MPLSFDSGYSFFKKTDNLIFDFLAENKNDGGLLIPLETDIILARKQKDSAVCQKGASMISKLLNREESLSETPREGDLYKELTIFGQTFRILYGYYEDFEREGKYNDPMPVYPDLASAPVYADDGKLIVTAIQDVCIHYKGQDNAEGDGCSDCVHYEHHEDLFGVCNCISRKLSPSERSDVQQE